MASGPALGESGMKAARFWEPQGDGRAHCTLCPHDCTFGPGATGTCRTRRNDRGSLISLVYGRPAAVNVDPIEKKPLFHFLPGTEVLSIGTVGCNLACRFCQNWDLSRRSPGDDSTPALAPASILDLARSHDCPSVAFTYNEPTLQAEFVADVAALARPAGLRIVMVTNGYVSRSALPVVYENVDAANVDLKAFSDEFYRTVAKGHLAPVLDTLVELVRAGSGSRSPPC